MRPARYGTARHGEATTLPEHATSKLLHDILDGHHGLASHVRRAQESYLTWHDFAAMPTPPGITTRDAWEALRSIHRASGVEISFAGNPDRAHWYYTTYEISDAIAIIYGHSMVGSGLFQRIADTRNAEVMVRYQVDEVIAAAELDGILIPAKAANAVPHLQRPPRGAADRLVYNTLAIVRDLPDYLEAPFSQRLFHHFHERLLENVDVDALVTSTPREGLIRPADEEGQAASLAPRDARRVMDSISACLNRSGCDPHINPIVAALLAPEAFRDLRPLPSMNDQVGRLVLRLAALKSAVPALGMLPLSRAKVRWLNGEQAEGPLSQPPAYYRSAHAEDADDLTGLITGTLLLTISALADLSGALERQADRDAELRSLVQADPELNYRQRSILGRALRDPEAEFRIAYHRDTHNVVYATARADLLGLVERGYLKMSQRGREFIFTPRPNLHTFIESSSPS